MDFRIPRTTALGRRRGRAGLVGFIRFPFQTDFPQQAGKDAPITSPNVRRNRKIMTTHTFIFNRIR